MEPVATSGRSNSPISNSSPPAPVGAPGRRTDWDKLANIRKEARDETAELETAKGVRKAVEGEPVDINHASRDELMTLPGIGEKTAIGIIEARPYQSLDDLKRASGIGPSTFEKIKAYVSVTPP